MGAAFFVDGGEVGRARKNFPGGVHDPRACAELDGVIIVEYMDNVPQSEDAPPLRLEIKDCRITAISGGGADGKLKSAIEASDGWIDSWHAGDNPRTVVPVARADNARSWFGFSHCSPGIMHYHLGRSHETTNLASFNHTLLVDGETLYADGQLAIYDDPTVSKAIKDSGMQEEMLTTRDLDLW